MSRLQRPKIGLALGSGVGRGWAHLGVIKALSELGVTPDIVCGTSIGALIAGFHVVGHLDALEAWARTLTKLSMVRYLNLRPAKNGLVAGDRLFAEMEPYLADMRIEDLPLPFACVATDMRTGQEIWISKGRLDEAIRASFSLPAFFPPTRVGSRWLIDGALVNPVPVSVCRALGADIVIAVNLNTSDFAHIATARGRVAGPAPAGGGPIPAGDDATRWLDDVPPSADMPEMPSLLGIMASTLNIVQDRVTRSRLAADPPDINIVPNISRVGLLDFYRAAELIAAGQNAAYLMEDLLDDLIGTEGALVQ